MILEHELMFRYNRGFAEGKSENFRENLIKLLNSGTLTVEQIAKIFEVDVEFVKGLEGMAQ